MRRLSVALFCLLLAAGSVHASSTSSGVSRDFNPAVSVNTLMLYSSGLIEAEAGEQGEEHEHGHFQEGFQIQETEVQLTANIDPYARADVILAMHDTEGIELEEGYVQATSLPRGLGLRAGAFYWEFGKHNCFHTHQFPFVERPVAWENLLGAHGLLGAAVEGSWLTPLPWYAEILATAYPLTENIYGDHEIPENTWGQVARLRQLWDLNDRSTLDLGLSWAGGKTLHAHEEEETREAGEEGRRHLLGADLTWKWIGPGAYPKQYELQAEWLRRLDDLDEETFESDGFYISARSRVSRRFWLGGRYDSFLPSDCDTEETEENRQEDAHQHAHEDVTTWAASLAFVPSEFQALRVDWLYRTIGDGDGEHGFRAQVNFTIGSHPAHRY